MVSSKNSFDIKKEGKKAKKNVKREIRLLFTPLNEWSSADTFLVLNSLMLIFGIIPKFLNVQTWLANDFDMSSYNVYSLGFYYPYTVIYIYVAYKKKVVSFLILGLIGLFTTLLMTYGFIKMYTPFPIFDVII